MNDAINILWKCGIRTPASLLLYLKKGGYKIEERQLRDKIKEIEKVGFVADHRAGRSGRQRVLSQKDQKQIDALIKREPEINAAEIKTRLGFSCSQKIIREYLHAIGLKFMRILRAPQLTPEQKWARVAFTKFHRHDDWRRTFFLDECTFLVGSHRHSCYQKPSARRYGETYKHPSKVNLLGMISLKGASRLIMFEENLTALLFEGYLKKLERDAEKIYDGRKFRIAMDRDPKHTADVIKNYISEKKLDVLQDWPASSPDLNPIENLWGLMEKEIQKLHVKTLYSLKKIVRSVWVRLTRPERLEGLVNSMEDRLKAVLASKGGHTKY